ncbi:hypothetical protein GCM10010430_13760 [Kitasatospora cystarginea]|uniref:Uncharacterized protein n=1 Tax=Kitasatospora cystarginea TaxID=58350 RepID=A0ABP5QGJ3_9ACTN
MEGSRPGQRSAAPPVGAAVADVVAAQKGGAGAGALAAAPAPPGDRYNFW